MRATREFAVSEKEVATMYATLPSNGSGWAILNGGDTPTPHSSNCGACTKQCGAAIAIPQAGQPGDACLLRVPLVSVAGTTVRQWLQRTLADFEQGAVGSLGCAGGQRRSRPHSPPGGAEGR
jgi:hypothetical protein